MTSWTAVYLYPPDAETVVFASLALASFGLGWLAASAVRLILRRLR